MDEKKNWTLIIGAIVSVLSLLGNGVQGYYNLKYRKSDKQEKGLTEVVKFRNERISKFTTDFSAAVKQMRKETQRLYLPDAGTLKASIDRIESERESLVSDVKGQEEIYKETFDKSYPLANMSWTADYSLSADAKAELRQRYTDIRDEEIRKKEDTDKLEKLFAFAGAVNPSWVRIRTLRSVNVRSGPSNTAQVVTQIPKNSECSVVSVKLDRSWVEIKGRVHSPFQGWVYVKLMEPSHSYLLN